MMTPNGKCSRPQSRLPAFPFPKHDKKVGPGARLNDVRQTGNQNTDCGEFFYGSFHGQ
jgi:hypothetical protein